MNGVVEINSPSGSFSSVVGSFSSKPVLRADLAHFFVPLFQGRKTERVLAVSTSRQA